MLLTRGVRMGQTEEGHMPDYRGRRVSLGSRIRGMVRFS